MAKQVKIEFAKTYATEANAVKAVEKVMAKRQDHSSMRYIVVPVIVEGVVRFSPLFIGLSAIEGGMHHHFNCVN